MLPALTGLALLVAWRRSLQGLAAATTVAAVVTARARGGRGQIRRQQEQLHRHHRLGPLERRLPERAAEEGDQPPCFSLWHCMARRSSRLRVWPDANQPLGILGCAATLVTAVAEAA